MPDPLGLQRHIPAPLRFVQPTEKHVHAPMQDALGMRVLLLAVRTLALRDRCHHGADLLGHTPGSMSHSTRPRRCVTGPCRENRKLLFNEPLADDDNDIRGSCSLALGS